MDLDLAFLKGSRYSSQEIHDALRVQKLGEAGDGIWDERLDASFRSGGEEEVWDEEGQEVLCVIVTFHAIVVR
jgi:hypothetical protein